MHFPLVSSSRGHVDLVLNSLIWLSFHHVVERLAFLSEGFVSDYSESGTYITALVVIFRIT